MEQLENLESFVIAEDVPVLANDCLPSEKFFVASKVVIGVTSPIWVPIGVVAFVLSVPVVGVVDAVLTIRSAPGSIVKVAPELI